MHACIIAAGTAACIAMADRARLPAGEPEVVPVGEGVYALIRHDPEAFANNANSLVVVGDSGVLVVDAQFTRAAALEMLAAIRKLTRQPVRCVVNTHWHDDHVAGNQVYRDSFPGVAFVAHDSMRIDLATVGADNRRATVSATGPYTARLRRLLAQGLGGDSTPVSALERAALESTVSIAERYAAEAPRFVETLPTITFDRGLSLFLGKRRVDVRYFGRANTRGDAVVIVPDASVVATGDLLVYPVPFAFASFPREWIGALDSIDALRPNAIIPGHGPLMRDDAYLRLVQRMLRGVVNGVDSAVAHGASLQDTQNAVRLPDLRRSVAGDEKWLNVLFTSFFLNPAIAAAFAQTAHR